MRDLCESNANDAKDIFMICSSSVPLYGNKKLLPSCDCSLTNDIAP